MRKSNWTMPVMGPRFLIMLLAALVWFSLSVTAGWAADQQPPPLRSASEIDYPPYCLVTEDNQADGFAVELLRAALNAMGRDVTFAVGSWPDVKKSLIDGRSQVLPLVGRTPEREALFDFTFPYLTMHGTIVVREETNSITTAADLSGKRVAVLQGDNAEEFLRRSDLGAVIVPRPSFELALRELAAGKHDAVVIQKLVAFQLMQKANLKNLRTVGPPLRDFVQNFCFAVRKGDHRLLATLNEGLAIVMADGTFRRLYAKWFSRLEAFGRTKSRIVIGGDSDYPPYEYLDRNGQPTGFNVDLTRAIARRAGLTVDIRLGPWQSIRNGLKTGAIDAVQGMFYTPERDRDFDFAPPTTVVQHAIVVRDDSPPLSDLKDLAGLSILVMAGDVMEDVALRMGYRNQLVSVASQEEALRLLAAGKYDCALTAKVPSYFWIKKHGWHNLTVSDVSVLSAEYCYAVPEGKQVLLSQLSEGLASIKETDEYRHIRDKWLNPYESNGVTQREVMQYLLIAVLPLVALLAGSLLWTRVLRQQVASRTRELTEEVAERKRAGYELLRAKEQAEAASRAKSVFLANMNHELRTPLNAILGFSNLMRTDRDLSDEQRKKLEIINNSGRHLLQLINEVLDMAKIEAGRIVTDATVFDLGMMVREVTDLMTLRAGEKGLFLVLDQSSQFPRFIRADAMKLRQVFLNLVGNALKFTSHGGVTVRLDALPCEGDDRLLLKIAVKDTGAGIAPADLERIFEPFVQIGAQAARKGTGLGLTITRQFVELMGGRLTVQSEPGAGSVFCVEVPVTKGGETEVSEVLVSRGRPVGLADNTSGIRVLIVEDERENWFLLQNLLELAGLSVRIAANGAEAVAAFSEWRPHFIWMDIRMPVMDGLEATRRIRGLAGGKEVKIAACTASVFSDERDKCLEAGMDDIIHKPYRMEEVFDCMTRYLGVNFVYEETRDEPPSTPPEKLSPQALAALPSQLRQELAEAVVSLDGEHVNELVQRIAEVNSALGGILAAYAERLSYSEILKALQDCSELADRDVP